MTSTEAAVWFGMFLALFMAGLAWWARWLLRRP